MTEINRSEVLADMLKELPWNTFKSLVQSNSQIHKRSTMGGHRLEPKWRKRIEKIFAQEAEKEDFPQALCNAVFVTWYPRQKQLHDKLEAHFNSEEYKEFLRQNGYDENAYILTEEEFDQFFQVADLQKWRALLCFSPLQFSKEQARKVVEDHQGSSELLAKLEEKNKALEERDSVITRLNNEMESSRNRLEPLNEEVQKLRRERREQKKTDQDAEKQLAATRKENERLRSQLEDKTIEVEHSRQEAQTELSRKTKVLQDDLERRNKELKSWQEKYEKQCRNNRELNDKIKKIEKTLADERIASDKNRKEIQRIHNFVDLVVERLDWGEIGRQIKLTPQLKLRFNSLIRNLRYDEDNKPRIDTSLEKFWSDLQRQEWHLIENIAHSDTREVETGNVEEFWQNLADSFEDVQISLEARTILIQVLREIFYQTIESKDLQTDTTPSSMSKTKKRS